jgi:hypothetical protein
MEKGEKIGNYGWLWDNQRLRRYVVAKKRRTAASTSHIREPIPPATPEPQLVLATITIQLHDVDQLAARDAATYITDSPGGTSAYYIYLWCPR